MPKSAIIHRSEPGWQAQLRDAFNSARELADFLQLDAALQNIDAAPSWPLRVPRAYARRMRTGDISDPLLLQVLPLKDELKKITGFVDDPLQEAAATPQTGIVHKYHGRALMIATGSCAIHCRYCFRREFDYKAHNMGSQQRKEALTYLEQNPDINELILSGGDPLMLPDSAFFELCEQIVKISSIQRLRIHTRLPVVLPARLEAGFIDKLSRLSLPVVMVVHINHANEIDDELRSKLLQMRSAGVTLLNQSVILKGINNSTDALIALSEALFDAGVLPYYLHLPDPVTGTAHFDVSEQEAKRLLGAATNRLPGYLVPRLVQEKAGLGAKQTILADL